MESFILFSNQPSCFSSYILCVFICVWSREIDQMISSLCHTRFPILFYTKKQGSWWKSWFCVWGNGTNMENRISFRCVQLAAHRLHAAQDGYECSLHKIASLLKTFFFFCSSVFISVCVFNVWPRDAKNWTPLKEHQRYPAGWQRESNGNKHQKENSDYCHWN